MFSSLLGRTKTSFPVMAPVGLQQVAVRTGFGRRAGAGGQGPTSPMTPGSPPAPSLPDTASIQHRSTAVPVATQIPDTNPSTQRPPACQNSPYDLLRVFSISTSLSESDLSPLKAGSEQSSLGSYPSSFGLSPRLRDGSAAPDSISLQGSAAGTTISLQGSAAGTTISLQGSPAGTTISHRGPPTPPPSPPHLEHAQ